ncbi:hypothetical protein K3495_g12239 [Podosphaera aphanis]|nr:hypothetical protein K3495_g12239 [Podosphaera aphanis]
MEHPPRTSLRPSGIPRISRLPVPKSTIRPVRSTEELLKIGPQPNHHLRHPASGEKILISPKTRTPSRNLEIPNSIKSPLRRNFSADIVQSPIASSRRKSSQNELLPKASQAKLSEYTDRRKSSTTVLEEPTLNVQKSPRSGRPSLSERTVETLQSIPSSPALRERDSGFFNSDAGSRPNSSCDHASGSPKACLDNPQTSTNSFAAADTASAKRPTATRSLKPPSKSRNIAILSSSIMSESSKLRGDLTKTTKTGSKKGTPQSLKYKTSVQNFDHKSSTSILARSIEDSKIEIPKRQSISLSTSVEARSSHSLSSSKLQRAKSVSTSGSDEPKPRQSSIALRDQIARAKAAKRAASTETKNGASFITEGNHKPVPQSLDFQISDDPFNQNIGKNHSEELLTRRIRAAQMDGRLNISAMGLKEIPDEVLNMYSLQLMGTNSWAEAVDLVRFVAADNELEKISDDVFPDIDPHGATDEIDGKENQFAALETIDLRRNKLANLPKGLRRLEMLTSLNLSNNFIDNSCFQIISQIKSLRELNLDANKLSDQLDPSLAGLKNLEILNLRQNSLTTLPDSFVELTRLRKLNIAENKFELLPFHTLSQLPLTELIAAKNNLSGALIPDDIIELPHLQVLDVTGNSLSSLHMPSTIKLPAIFQLNCSTNRLEILPHMTGWVSLVTIAAEDNNIGALPQDFFALPKARNVNLSGNNIRILDERIARMSTLDVLLINGNPIRDKKLIGLSTESLKRALEAKLEPEPENEKDSDTFFSSHESPLVSPCPTSSGWVVQTGGILDRSNLQSDCLDSKTAMDVATTHKVKVLRLRHNKFSVIPKSLSIFAATLTTLSLSHNKLIGEDFIDEKLELPLLKDLNLSSNTLSSLQPLCHYLQAPVLERLDISFNRITTLPILRNNFPCLTTLLASHNKIEELTPDSIKGLQVVDCSSNEINALNSRIGLLSGPQGLKHFDISGNRFRVPNYSILEKGTEATLAWLRARVPEDELDDTDIDGVD